MATGCSLLEGGHEPFYDFPCSLCDKESKHIEAAKYCEECFVYMCTSCVKFHNRFPLNSRHRLLENSQFTTKHDGGTVDQYRKQLKALEIKYATQESQVLHLRRNVESLSVELEDSRRKLEKQTDEKEKLQNENRQLKQSVLMSPDTVSNGNLALSLEQIKEQLETKEREYNNLEKIMRGREQDFSEREREMRREIEDLKEKIYLCGEEYKTLYLEKLKLDRDVEKINKKKSDEVTEHKDKRLNVFAAPTSNSKDIFTGPKVTERRFNEKASSVKSCPDCGRTFPADVDGEILLDHQMSHLGIMCPQCKMLKPENMTDDVFAAHVNGHYEAEEQ